MTLSHEAGDGALGLALRGLPGGDAWFGQKVNGGSETVESRKTWRPDGFPCACRDVVVGCGFKSDLEWPTYDLAVHHSKKLGQAGGYKREYSLCDQRETQASGCGGRDAGRAGKAGGVCAEDPAGHYADRKLTSERLAI